MNVKRLVWALVAVALAVSVGRSLAGAGEAATHSACAKPKKDTCKDSCMEYGSCSLHADLRSAGKSDLAMWKRERKEDGQTYTDFRLPHFEAHDLAGVSVSSARLLGTPTLIAFLAVHCTHSLETLPLLQELQRELGPRGVKVLAVYVNSGSSEDLRSWLPAEAHPEFEVWSYPQASLGDVIHSHLVPAFFFVDADGRVRQKLVGYKAKEALADAVQRQLLAGPAAKDSAPGSSPSGGGGARSPVR